MGSLGTTLRPTVVGSAPGDLMYSSQIPLTGRQALVIYDAELDKWLKFLGDATGGAYAGLQNGVPPEVMLRLCKEVGAHPWFTMPYLSLDPPTDFTAGLAGYAKSYAESNASWMIPRYEPANEDWNTAAGFDQTPYGQAKATARWGIASTHDHYGRVLSLLGQGISSVYGDDRTKYQVICGVQTMGGAPSGSNARMGGRHVSVDGGSAASLWATHVAVANYYTPSIYGSGTETSMAAAYDAADAAGKLVIAAQYAAYADNPSGTYVIDTVAAAITAWKNWAAAFSPAKVLTFYEGGYSPDYINGETQKNALRAASKDAPELATYARKMFSECLRRGGEFPSVFQLSGANTAWSVFDPDIYRSTEPPQWTAIADVAFSATPVQFRFV